MFETGCLFAAAAPSLRAPRAPASRQLMEQGSTVIRWGLQQRALQVESKAA